MIKSMLIMGIMFLLFFGLTLYDTHFRNKNRSKKFYPKKPKPIKLSAEATYWKKQEEESKKQPL